MSNNLLRIFKETALPGVLEPNSMYLVAPPGKPNYVEIYVTGTTNSVVKRLINEADVLALIAAHGGGGGTTELKVVANIAERDLLPTLNTLLVFVIDATGDLSVTEGSATYIGYPDSGDYLWAKVSEYESLDLILDWANIINKPTSTVADIDDAVTKKHTHTNITQLNKIGEDGSGNFQYNGQYPDPGLASQNW